MSKAMYEFEVESPLQSPLAAPNPTHQSDTLTTPARRPVHSFSDQDFLFGIEGEYCLATLPEFKPIWHPEIDYRKLDQIFESIDTSDLGDCSALGAEFPHQRAMPYLIEGYHLMDADWQACDMKPKGIEIRTPVFNSLEGSLEAFRQLRRRLRLKLEAEQLAMLPLSHHPVATHFHGPQNKRRHDYWQWSMEVMTTFGPDINVRLPIDLQTRLDPVDLEAKINFYAAAITCFSLGSPFRAGELWKIRGKIGKSLRTYRRSILAPPIEFHPDENHRMEFKLFEMSPSTTDFRNAFLLFLTVALDPKLAGRASKATRIYDLGSVAIEGFASEGVVEKAEVLLQSAHAVLPAFGFDTSSLDSWHRRLVDCKTPADQMIEAYQRFEREQHPNPLQAVLALRYQQEIENRAE